MLLIIQKLKLLCGKIIVFVLIFAASVSQVKAQSSGQFLTFADGPLSAENWELVLGDLNDWQVIGGRLQGDLQPPPAISSYISAITFQPALWPVTANYQFAFDFTPLDSADKNFGVIFDHHKNSKGKVLLTYLSFHFSDEILCVENFQNHYATHKTRIPCSLEPGVTYHMRLIYQKPDFELYINDQLFYSSKNDKDFWPDFLEPGRPLFYLTKGQHDQSAVIYDNFYLSFFPQLSVPYFSQLDTGWGPLIYDHSQEFFDPPLTMASSACALTSAAMLLKYYGRDSFPNDDNWPSELRGQKINPETLNLWLKNEGDGYLGVGLVNWLAIARLSLLLAQSSADNKTSLEFTYANYQAETIVQQVLANQPVIADLGGHFVLISGINDSEKNQDGQINDYLINDPISRPTTLDHELKPIKSLRLFNASQTDLSYFLLISGEPLDVKLFSGEEKSELELVESREKNLLDEQNDWHLYYLAKPESANYTWQFSANDLNKLALAQLLIYQKNGQVQIFNLADYPSRKLNLIYDKEQLAELTALETNSYLLKYHQYLLSYFGKLQTEQFLLGQAHNALRYQNLIEQFLNFYQL